MTNAINTIEGETVISKGNAVDFPSGSGEATRVASILITQSEKLARLNKVVGMHEQETDIRDNWTERS